MVELSFPSTMWEKVLAVSWRKMRCTKFNFTNRLLFRAELHTLGLGEEGITAQPAPAHAVPWCGCGPTATCGFRGRVFPELALGLFHGGVLQTASPKPSPVDDIGKGPPLGVNGSVSVSVSPSAR